jgi:hypothetical protein
MGGPTGYELPTPHPDVEPTEPAETEPALHPAGQVLPTPNSA